MGSERESVIEEETSWEMGQGKRTLISTLTLLLFLFLRQSFDFAFSTCKTEIVVDLICHPNFIPWTQ